ncbi:MAG: hypothetical protein DMF68_16550 [Acidobacteria bacterium]|nr:MAG: hypothetical protein DMF68_16550 [Acidobacteriota bacterium]
MLKPCYILFIILTACALSTNSVAQTGAPSVRLAILDFGETETARRASSRLALALSSNNDFSLIDRDESRAAALGAGYKGSLNMSLQEARDLGAATGADFYITGDAQTIRRSSSARPAYYESYASVFIVSARTGKLVLWDRPSFEAASPVEAEESLLKELNSKAERYVNSIRKALEAERQMRAQMISDAGASPPVIEDAPDDEASAAREGVRLPQPYRRLRPSYTEEAARAEAEATVDVEVEIDTNGEVSGVEVVRWAGFGLDEATTSTVKQLHFRPAVRDGLPIPMRVLLRYNFRKPPK